MTADDLDQIARELRHEMERWAALLPDERRALDAIHPPPVANWEKALPVLEHTARMLRVSELAAGAIAGALPLFRHAIDTAMAARPRTSTN